MTEGNLVRACPRHRVVLLERKRGEGLWCPAGRHDVKRWLVVDRSKCRALYEASAEKGAERMAEEKVKVDEHQAKTVTIERQKFQDATGASLFIRLSREPKKWGGDPFRIRWTHVPLGSVQSKKGTTGGVSKTTAAELDGRAAFKAAVAEAVRLGWKPVTISRGARVLELRPIPPPKKRAA